MNESTRHPEILAFDLDGTIVPTTEPGIEKFQSILIKLGFDPPDDDDIRKHWGNGFRKVVTSVIFSLGGNVGHVEEFIRLEHELPDKIYFNPDLPIVLDKLRMKYHLALVTSRSKNSFLKLSSQMNFPPQAVFQFIQTLDDCQHIKPDPKVFAPLIKWAAKKGIGRENITYFGDTSEYDWPAAKNSGIKFIGVVSGASKASEFLAAGVSDLIYQISGLSAYLEEKLLKPVKPSFNHSSIFLN